MSDKRAYEWLVGNDTGTSSKALWVWMMGGVTGPHGPDYPHDPADLGRCLRLLEIMPEWKARIPEMAQHGWQWATLAARWDDLAESMDDEVGIDWSKGRSAPKTYELMRRIFDERREAA